MTTSPVLASYNVLRHVAYADRRLTDAERKRLDDVARELGVRADARPMHDDFDTYVACITDASLREKTMRAAIALANVDGYCSDDEKALLDRLAAAFGLGPVQLVAGQALRETPELVAAKAAATEHFLQKMSAARAKGDLTQQTYERLVSEMNDEIRATV